MAYECKTYYTNNIIKLTKPQYDSLKNGETVKGYTLNTKDTFVLDIDSLYNDIPIKTSQLENDSGYLTSADVGDFAHKNHTHNFGTDITNRGEAFLDWGGRSIANGVSPVGSAMSSDHSANRLAFLNPNAIAIEYSDDGGTTWTDAGASDDSKINLVTLSSSIKVGLSTPVTTSQRTRITITACDGTNIYFYNRPRKLLLFIGSIGHGLSVTVQCRLGSSSDANWATFGTYALSGNSGWNDIPLDFGVLGAYTTSQEGNYWYLRLVFAVTSVYSSNSLSNPAIYALRMFGDQSWKETSNMGKTGHLYSYNSSQYATFPSAVFATSFIENGTSLANKYLGIDATAKKSYKLVSPNTRPVNANFDHVYIDGFASQRLDIASASMTTGKPSRDGFITTYFWDNAGNWDAQLFIPNSDININRIQIRTKDGNSTWQYSRWVSIPYMSDIPTKTSQLTNDSGYLTSANLTNYETKNEVKDTLSSAGWYRIAEYGEKTLGQYANSCELIIKRVYNNGNNEYHQIQFLSTYNNQSFKSIDKSNIQYFTKIRFVNEQTNNKSYLEVYYNADKVNGVYFKVNNGNDRMYNWSAITPVVTAETVDGVTVIATYDIPANANPVNSLDIPTKVSELENDSGYLDKMGTIANANKLVSSNYRPTSANFDHDYITNYVSQRLDISSGSMTEGKPTGEGFITTYFWDNSGNWDTQLFIPIDANRLQLRRQRGATWQYSSWVSIPYMSDIPTKTSQLTNDSGFITSHQSLANYVTLNTEQTISSKKTFSGGIAITSALENKDMVYFLGIDSFGSGGAVKWINKNDIKLPYSQITGTPTIPTVNNGTLTIQRNGTAVATFTANQAGNTTANITVPNPTDYYWANVKVSSNSSTATTPSVQKIGITGSTTTTAAAAVTMEYDSSYKALKFVFA